MSKKLSRAAREWLAKIPTKPAISAAAPERKAIFGFPQLSEHSVAHRFAEITAPRSKYSARKVTADGHTFDSWLEFSRYQVLREMQGAGKITGLTLQNSFELQPRFKKGGKTYRAITYIADFTYRDVEGNQVVEDTKGFKTEAFMIKHKMFEYKFQDLTLRIINGHARKNTRG